MARPTQMVRPVAVRRIAVLVATSLAAAVWAIDGAAAPTPPGTIPATAPASRPAADGLVVRVTARRWAWSFRYPDGRVTDELHLPADGPVTLLVGSRDVIHSMYIPAWRVKVDAMPERESWAKLGAPREPGTLQLLCAEFCGERHSVCGAKVVVHPAGEFEAWLAAKPQTGPATAPATRPAGGTGR